MPTQARPLDEAELLHRTALLAQAFRPAAPVDRRGLFSGRGEQIGELFSVAAQAGQHAVVYGERGVGKTSLAAVVAELLAGSKILTARTNCDASDDFTTVWRKALGELVVHSTAQTVGFAGETTREIRPASLLLGTGPVAPHDVVRALETVTHGGELALFVDEFDRLRDAEARTLFADVVKTLSDRLVRATVVLVGVADSVGDLIREHRSVERALVQVRMPRMSRAELAEIATRGIAAAQMTIRPAAVDRVTALSQGLPHYTHLLTQLAGQAALAERRADVDVPDVEAAVERAIERAAHSVSEAYYRAAGEIRRRHVLLACALADEDEFGFFSPAQVEARVSRVGGRLDAEALAGELDALAAGDEAVLQRGGPGGGRYRFANPLVQPYVVMRGLADGVVKTRDLR
ncbi:MAG: ATP-binding protein [Thermoleophilia bacterium]|nr:ATP-binding protein [Thermoleophilia bacterium]